MKKLLAVLLALTLVLSMSAVAFAAEDGKITIWTWDPNFNIASMKIGADMYHVDHPDVEIEIQEVQSEDIETAVAQAAVAGDLSTLPDIMLCQDNSFQKMVINYPEVYTDITDKYDFEGFGEAKAAYSTVEGRHYGIPFDAGTVVAAYRTDYLAEAGYTVADLTDITWTEFAEKAKEIKEKTGKPVFCTQAGSGDWILIMIQSCGASMFTEEGAVNLKDNEAIKAAITVYADLVKQGIILETNSWDEMIGTLANGSVCGTFNGCWILGSIMATADQSGKWDITNLPSLEGIEGATHYSNNGGSSWAITQGTDVDLALDFMQLYRNVDFYNAILPTTSAIATLAPAKEAPNYTAVNEFMGSPVFATIVEYGMSVPSNITGAYYYDARNAMATAITNYINGADLDSELAQAEDTVNFAMGF